MADNRLGELPWLIDTTTGRPNGVRTQRGEEVGVVTADPRGGLYAGGAPLPANAAIQSLSRGGRAVAIGDSLEAGGLVTTGTSAVYTARSVTQIAAAKLNQRLRVIYSDGVNGTTLSGTGATTFFSRFDAAVANRSPGWVILVGCSNDIDQDRTSDQIMSAVDGLEAILAKSQAIGANLVFVNTSCGNFGTDARFTQWYDVHRRCLNLAREGSGFFYFPMFPGAVDYSTEALARYAVAKSGMLYDSRHPAAFGAHTVYAEAIAEYFTYGAALPPTKGTVIGDRSGLSGAVGDLYNYIRNGTFSGSGGSVGAGNSGAMPTAFDGARTGSITSVFSSEARTDRGAGMWLVCTLSSAAAATDTVTVNGTGANNASFLIPIQGQQAHFEIDVDAVASSGTLGQIEAQIQILDSASSVLFTAAANQIVSTEYLGVTTFRGRLRTPDFTVPATADRARVVCKMGTSAGGAAVVKWAAAELRPGAST